MSLVIDVKVRTVKASGVDFVVFPIRLKPSYAIDIGPLSRKKSSYAVWPTNA